MKPIIKLFTSLRLTVVCLAFGVVLVFLGTLAQVNEGLYLAQSRWFRSFFIWWGPQGAHWSLPIFPGGYLIGGLLLINLIASHISRFQKTWKKLGIHVVHAGIILLLVGQLATDLLSHETQMRFAEGETRSFSESALRHELVFASDVAKPNEEEIVSIPESLLVNAAEIRHEKLPFTIRVKEYHKNAQLRAYGPMVDTNGPVATSGIGSQAVLVPLPEIRDTEQSNMPAVVLAISGPGSSSGTWVAWSKLGEAQEIKAGEKVWRMAFRSERQYLPYSMQLLKTTYEVYPGTEIPKNFQSRVRIDNPQKSEQREVDIYMNNPLRYDGLTFYQYQMGRDEVDPNRPSSTLQVVKNPGWLTPYMGCLMVGGGMVIQFMMHLVGFISKRRPA